MGDVRLAGAADAEALAALAEHTFRDTYAAFNAPEDMDAHCGRSFSAALQAREIADPRIRTLLCERAGVLAGFAQLHLDCPSAAVTASRPAEIRRFYVGRHWHGQGVAHALMEATLAVAARAGADAVWLGVWQRNPRALRFYEKQGFAVCGEQFFQLGADAQRDHVMALRLGG